MLSQQLTLNCRGRLLLLEKPVVMGILNISPDSFYDGGQLTNEKAFLEKAGGMLEEGAAILDLGGQSTRPGARMISQEEEMERVIPAIKRLVTHFPDAIVSMDTFRAVVAAAAISEGASIINDISGGQMDDNMYQTVARLQVPYVLMHMQGRPESMQNDPRYQDVALEILDYFIERVGILRALDVHDIILDPGFGFGKTLEHNFELLEKLHVFKILDFPILAGISRKSMVWKVLDISPQEALNGTTALHMIALQQGARILRVHDVKEAVQTIRLFGMLKNPDPSQEETF